MVTRTGFLAYGSEYNRVKREDSNLLYGNWPVKDVDEKETGLCGNDCGSKVAVKDDFIYFIKYCQLYS